MISAVINTKVHDKAQVASISFTLSVKNTGIDPLKDRLNEQLRITNKWADEQGALIGHVKAYIQWAQDKALMLSTTGEEVDIKGSEIPLSAPDKLEVGITAIVFGIEMKMVTDRLCGIAAVIVGQYGEYCVYKNEHNHEHNVSKTHKNKTLKARKQIHIKKDDGCTG
jgi:hypothetical protein